MHLYLIGYRGTGKTTVGALVAERLSLNFVDLDDQVESQAQRSISEIFAQEGEPAFRDLEEAALRSQLGKPPQVVSTGGGVVIRSANRDCLQESGRSVWLNASVATIVARLQMDPLSAKRRPRLQEEQTMSREVESMLSKREAWYREVADLEMATDSQPPEEIADEISRWWIADS